MQTFIEKKNNQYQFSETGNSRAYFLTMEKILTHYMINQLKIDQNTVSQKMTELESFVSKNFLFLDDYPIKIKLFADFIEEANIQRLITFIGKLFVSVLQKIKIELMEKEKSQYVKLYEEPFHKPSDRLLDLVYEEFSKSTDFIWPSPKRDESSEASEKTALFSHSLNSISQQISFREYAAVLGIISKFNANRDQKAYTKWFKSNSKKIKALIYINHYFNDQQKKGKDIQWKDAFTQLADQLKIDILFLRRMQLEIKSYREIISKLRSILSDTDQEIKKIYHDITILLDKNVSDGIHYFRLQKVSLKMLLLQIHQDPIKEDLYTEVSKLIDSLSQLENPV